MFSRFIDVLVHSRRPASPAVDARRMHPPRAARCRSGSASADVPPALHGGDRPGMSRRDKSCGCLDGVTQGSYAVCHSVAGT